MQPGIPSHTLSKLMNYCFDVEKTVRLRDNSRLLSQYSTVHDKLRPIRKNVFFKETGLRGRSVEFHQLKNTHPKKKIAYRTVKTHLK